MKLVELEFLLLLVVIATNRLEWDLICSNLFFRKTKSVRHQER